MFAIVFVPSATQGKLVLTGFAYQREDTAIQVVVEPELADKIGTGDGSAADDGIGQAIAAIRCTVFVFLVIPLAPG